MAFCNQLLCCHLPSTQCEMRSAPESTREMVVCMVFSVSVFHHSRGDANAALMMLMAYCISDCVRVGFVVTVIGYSDIYLLTTIVAQKRQNV